MPAAGKDFALREIAKWESLITQSLHKLEPVLTEILMWLKANAPAVQRLAFVHSAYRTGNLIVKDDSIAAIIDWELQVIGDPMYDVAYISIPISIVRVGALWSAQDSFLDYYQQLTGLKVDLAVCRYYGSLHDAEHCILVWCRIGTIRRGPQQGFASGTNDVFGPGGSGHGGQGVRFLTLRFGEMRARTLGIEGEIWNA